ncbi:MAG: PEP-CTERM sorting domain-containing protein [Planctomycetota bacterium]
MRKLLFRRAYAYNLGLILVAGVCCFVGQGSSIYAEVVVTPSSYSLLNGELGGDVPNFFDDTYNGTGDNNTPLAPLSGGLGDLTDGIVATQNWNAQHGRYVGWQSIDPTITFEFANPVALSSLELFFDDAQFGGVDNPASVIISNGLTSINHTVIDPAGNGPFSSVVNTAGLTGNSFDVTIRRQFVGGSNRWVMVSEVQFAVPEPSSAFALFSAAFGISLRRRRR